MSDKGEKLTIIIKNKLYGDKEYPCYVREGLAVYKMGKSWFIGSISAKQCLNSRLNFNTLKEASERRNAMLKATPSVDWTADVVEMHPEIEANRKLFGY